MNAKILKIAAILSLASCLILDADDKRPLILYKDVNIGGRLSGELVRIESRITNICSETIVIKKVKASCGCMNVNVSSFVLKPTESAEIITAMDSFGKEGGYKGAIWVFTAKPREEIYKINISGTFEAPHNKLDAFPKCIEIKDMLPDTIIQRVVRIRRENNLPVRTTDISSTSKWIGLDIVDKEIDVIKLKLTLEPPSSTVNFNEEIIVSGDDPNDIVRIKCIGNVLPHVQVFPKMVLLDPDKNEYRIVVKANGNIIPSIIDHSFDGNGLKLLSFKEEAGCFIVVVNRDRQHKGFAEGKLFIEYQKMDQRLVVTFVSAGDINMR